MSHVVVRVMAIVRADGSAEEVRVTEDPGYGFGPAARACALKHTYVPARNETGEYATGSTQPFAVYFDR